MKEELISLETAKLAKEKGFKLDYSDDWYEPNNFCYCYHRYSNKYIAIGAYFADTNQNFQQYDVVNKETFDAPTQSLLQKWLREIYNIHVQILPYNNKFLVSLLEKGQYGSNPNFEKEYNTYEEALEMGLQEALKLIN